MSEAHESGACCASCAAGKPCEGCNGGGAVSGELVTDARDAHPATRRQRSVTGAHRAATLEFRDHHVPESGGLEDNEREFLRSLPNLPATDRAQALRDYMAANRASAEQTRAALAALAQGGIATLQQHLDGNREIRLREIDQQGQTARNDSNNRTRVLLARIAAQAGQPPPTDPDAIPQGGMTTTPTTPAPAAPMSTETKVLIGVGAVGVVGVIGYLLYASAERARREDEERRRRDDEYRRMAAGVR